MAITSAFQADDVGSIPTARSNMLNADIAQLVEHTLGKGEIGSSNLPISTMSYLCSIFIIFMYYLSEKIRRHRRGTMCQVDARYIRVLEGQ